MLRRTFLFSGLTVSTMLIQSIPLLSSQNKVRAQSPTASSSLLHEAERQLTLMKTSFYQHATDVDESIGRFNYDCSGFLDYALQKISPQAYAELPVSKSKRPLAQDFYQLFSNSRPKSSHWVKISKVSYVRAGDVVVWLRPPDSDSHNTGHVMVVRDQPTVGSQSNEWLIPVIDSTASPHAQDSRSKEQTGLGTGVIGVIVDSQDKPIAFRWKGGESKKTHETAIAFGRLLR